MKPQNINTQRLFFASCMALIVTAMTFAVRANIIGDLGKEFGLSHEEMGWVAGTAFWGFTVAMILGGPLCDILGMKKLIMFAPVFGFCALHTIIELKGNPVKYGGSTRYCNLHPAQAELLLTECHCGAQCAMRRQ